ncbi:hypothetical protein GEV29_05730 [Aeromicrobium sp. SMF47]|uniref:hypothetical protein n=1 Tax=Aeromicrobium yanjiei TaxID=2662028 RepID=UPI00129E805C|nr:hypothetical protein [Aeromicrobium yanjiei]MRJ76029.1 hypothetical protein [Aeromicrobium yanjiei]
MPEVELGFPRTYVEFANPDDPTEVFRCDLTWLTSRWTCIFGQGCPGIYDTSPDAGCCTLGAHFADDEDAERTRAIMVQLTPEQWENHDEGHRSGWTERDDDGELKTRAFRGACIFHNSRSFPGGYGCALHGFALSNDLKPHTTKPDVCWQLPLRRQFRDVDRGDGTTYTETEIGEYTRAGWGPGGADLDWYCSSNTEAHVGPEPVYRTNRDELAAMMGEAAYAELARHCRDHEARGANTPHLADPPR